MKALFTIVGITMFLTFVAFSSTNPFDRVDKTDASNSVKAIEGVDSVEEFLSALFSMSKSATEVDRNFGNENLSRIARGYLQYNVEFAVSLSDWNLIVDAFLSRGFLGAKTLQERKAFGILLTQRPTPLCIALAKRERLEVQIPDTHPALEGVEASGEYYREHSDKD